MRSDSERELNVRQGIYLMISSAIKLARFDIRSCERTEANLEEKLSLGKKLTFHERHVLNESRRNKKSAVEFLEVLGIEK